MNRRIAAIAVMIMMMRLYHTSFIFRTNLMPIQLPNAIKGIISNIYRSVPQVTVRHIKIWNGNFTIFISRKNQAVVPIILFLVRSCESK